VTAMVTIREARSEDFPRIYPLLLEFHNEALTREHWSQVFVDHSGLQNDRFGWVLLDEAEVVGFVGTILSERTIRGEKVRLSNTCNWIVRNEYRAHSLALYAKALADKTVAVTNLSPTPQVLKLLVKLGFTLMDKSERIIVPVVTPRTVANRCEIVTDARAVGSALDGERLRFFRDHQLPYHHHALVRAPEGDCYLMMNRSPKAIAGRLRLPFARVHHLSSPEVFGRNAAKIVAHLAAALRVVAMIVDERMLGGHIPWHSFTRPGGKRTAAFRSDKLTGQDIDGLYTEAVLLNY
jgi:hypothetical protein